MRLKFIIVVMLQIALLCAIIVYKQRWIDTGKKILLKSAPVDPRSLFRGDYVVLTYEISSLDLDKISVKDDFKTNEKVYVVLTKGKDGIYNAKSVTKILPHDGDFIQARVTLYNPYISRWEITIKKDTAEELVLEPPWFYSFKEGDTLTFCINDNLERIVNLYKADDPVLSKYGCPDGRTLTGTVKTAKEFRTRMLTLNFGIESYFVEEGKGRIIETARNTKALVVEAALDKKGKAIISALIMDGKKLF
ncbi:hypothetical protein MCHI_001325 [Candidatus Magnetoovum chiemensis]|nr:hypothetical protein MCHI_001325 [Candidatus Magnetoovum chiemensis]